MSITIHFRKDDKIISYFTFPRDLICSTSGFVRRETNNGNELFISADDISPDTMPIINELLHSRSKFDIIALRYIGEDTNILRKVMSASSHMEIAYLNFRLNMYAHKIEQGQ